MGSVYSEALFTLAAADSQQHSEGMFRPREAQCLRPFRIDPLKYIPYRDRTQFDGEDTFYIFPATSKTHQGVRPKGPLDTRGWTLQEQILSPRILYYGHGELFWDCLTISASESSPISASLLNDNNPTETWALKLLRKSIARSADMQIFRRHLADVWRQVVQNYSARKLTMVSDKIIAMEGILNAVAKIIDEAPIAGMWRTDLWSQLIWWKNSASERTGSNDKDLGFVAPSWSWLSSDSPVFYHNTLHAAKSEQNHDFTELISSVSIDAINAGSAPGQVGICSHLTLTGPCFWYRLTNDDLYRPVAWKQWNKSKLKINPGRWMLDFQTETPLDVRCIVMAEDEVAKLLDCNPTSMRDIDQLALLRKPQITFSDRLTNELLSDCSDKYLREELRRHGFDSSRLTHKWELIHVSIERREFPGRDLTHAKNERNSDHTTFFDLSGELRNKVYEFSLLSGKPIIVEYDRKTYDYILYQSPAFYAPATLPDNYNYTYKTGITWRRPKAPKQDVVKTLEAMRWTNRQLAEEATSHFFAKNTFEIRGVTSDCYNHFLSSIPMSGAKTLTSLVLGGNNNWSNYDDSTFDSLRGFPELANLTIRWPDKVLSVCGIPYRSRAQKTFPLTDEKKEAQLQKFIDFPFDTLAQLKTLNFICEIIFAVAANRLAKAIDKRVVFPKNTKVTYQVRCGTRSGRFYYSPYVG
ncbi:MAP kinase kinase (MEK) [Kalmusia sp. IMI 367209]|nr:MAP kinase kinase (MEK) [Kalmusia sp. IMI 367209]